MLSVLGGALFKFWVGLVVVLSCAGFGSLFCYFISLYLGHPIVEKYLKARIAKLDEKIESKRDQLFFYFAFLRVTPFIPSKSEEKKGPGVQRSFLHLYLTSRGKYLFVYRLVHERGFAPLGNPSHDLLLRNLG